MIFLSPWKPLLLESPSQPERGAFFSAASGILRIEHQLYVIADDENALGVFPLHNDQPGKLVTLFNEQLPLDHEERKAAKVDLESLTQIPPCEDFPHGALMALGSGSKKLRRRGLLIPFTAEGDLSPNLVPLDLADLYDQLKNHLGKLNIEGAVIHNSHLTLFQRGNKKNHFNGTISFPLAHFFDVVLRQQTKLTPIIREYPLGDIQGVPLCFTDATALPNGDIVFTAAAEDTSDAYLDGANLGSAIGIIRDEKLLCLENIDVPIKIEGISATLEASGIHLLVVSDADDATKPAMLFRAQMQNYPG